MNQDLHFSNPKFKVGNRSIRARKDSFYISNFSSSLLSLGLKEDVVYFITLIVDDRKVMDPIALCFKNSDKEELIRDIYYAIYDMLPYLEAHFGNIRKNFIINVSTSLN